MHHTIKMRWLTIAASLCAAANIAIASGEATFTDSWHDTLVHNSNGDTIDTNGSFNIKISLPLDGVDLSAVDSSTIFTLYIGHAGYERQIVFDSFLGVTGWTPGKTNATFVLTDPYTENNIGNLTVNWTATTISFIGSASVDILAEAAIFSAASEGSPTNYNLDSSITGTYYEIAVSFGPFNYGIPKVPVTGSDEETDPNPDGNGPYPLETGSVTGTADLTPPVLTITGPPADTKVYNNNSFELEGHASDGVGISNIVYYVNGDINNKIETSQFPADAPTNMIAWTAAVNLSENSDARLGNNIITVIATDTLGNTASLSRTFVWIETNIADVGLNPPNVGTIKGITNGQVLHVGNSYAVTATATNKDWIFSDWTDGLRFVENISTHAKPLELPPPIISSNATFVYVDTDGQVTANFLPNPFNNTALAGTYTALFYDNNNGIELDDAGYISLSVTGTGGYSGRLYLASSDSFYTLSGQLAEARDGTIATAEFTIPIGAVVKSEYLAVNLQIDTDTNLSDPGAGMLGGFVNAYSDKTETNLLDAAEIQGQLSLYDTNISAGLYNIVISPVSIDPSQGPGGYGYGSATVSDKTGAAGAVALVLHLADGTSPALSFSTFLASNGVCPLYGSLYSGKGVIMGWMQFALDGSRVISNNAISWEKTAAADKYYTNGFTATPALFGRLYVPPKAGTNILGWENGEFIVDLTYKNLSLPDAIYVPANFDPNNNTFTASDRVAITLTATTGALSGSFYPAASRAAFSGVVIPDGDAGAGYGFYTDTNKETGPILIDNPALMAQHLNSP
jgi:hypothetical protein